MLIFMAAKQLRKANIYCCILLSLSPLPAFLLFASNMYYDVWIRNIKIKRTVTEQGKTFYMQPFKVLLLLDVFSLILSHLEGGGTKE